MTLTVKAKPDVNPYNQMPDDMWEKQILATNSCGTVTPFQHQKPKNVALNVISSYLNVDTTSHESLLLKQFSNRNMAFDAIFNIFYIHLKFQKAVNINNLNEIR